MRVVSGKMRLHNGHKECSQIHGVTSHASALALSHVVSSSSVGARPGWISGSPISLQISTTLSAVTFSSTDFHQIFCFWKKLKRRAQGEQLVQPTVVMKEMMNFFMFIYFGRGDTSSLSFAPFLEHQNEYSGKAIVFQLGTWNTGSPVMTLSPRKKESFYMASVFSLLLRWSPKKEKNTRGWRKVGPIFWAPSRGGR